MPYLNFGTPESAPSRLVHAIC